MTVQDRVQELKTAIAVLNEQVATLDVYRIDLQNQREQVEGDLYELWCQKDALLRELEAKLKELDG